MSEAPIFNFIQIDDCTATAGQPTRNQFGRLCADGYEVVINLAPDGLETSLPGEDEILDRLGLAYHHIPVPWTAPLPEHLDAFTATMDAVAGRRTLIHCQANMRVTAFYSLYALARLGWSEAEAQTLRDRIWTTRPSFAMDETWSSFIQDATRRIVAARE